MSEAWSEIDTLLNETERSGRESFAPRSGGPKRARFEPAWRDFAIVRAAIGGEIAQVDSGGTSCSAEKAGRPQTPGHTAASGAI